MVPRVQFEKKKASQVVWERLERAAEELNKLKHSRGRFHVTKRGFARKVLAFETRDLLLAVVGDDTRPTRFAVVGLAAGDRSLFPSYVEADFAEVCALLGATTAEEVDKIRRLVEPWSDYTR